MPDGSWPRTPAAGRCAVDMGPARLDWRDIPLARAMDTLHVAVGAGPLGDAVAVNMGNPHAVFFVDDARAAPLAELGPSLETDPLFPERANIGVAQRLASDRLRLRVWERGAGPHECLRHGRPAPQRSPAPGAGSPDAALPSSSTVANWESSGARTAMSR